MRSLRLLAAAALALITLLGVVLALSWEPPGVAKAEDVVSAAPRRAPSRTDGPSAAAQHPNQPDQPQEWEQGIYYKDRYIDYAPSGVPDFDQRQDAWGIGSSPGAQDWQWTHCGPVAAANSLWWFDSKFEPNPQGPTGQPPALPVNDNYPLVTSYLTPTTDDHDPLNVEPFVTDLASYLGTDVGIAGTNVFSLATGLRQYIASRGLQDRYYVSLRGGPTIDPEAQPLDMNWVYTEVMKSEDVILLLGFYQENPPGHWVRTGGHYVTVVGVTRTLAGPSVGVVLSDPIGDWAEAGGPGRVGTGALIPHPIPHTSVYTIHNDAGNVSHDLYWTIQGSGSPGGDWWIPDYAPPLEILMSFQDVNPHPHPGIEPGPFDPGLRVHTEVEYAVAVSPMFWKKGYSDYAPGGVPDFDMRQDEWGSWDDQGIEWHWTHDGPTAWANSFWWFDAKFNDEITRSAIVAYEHVSPSVPLLIRDLANYAGTDQGIKGTSPISLSYGIDRYLAEKGLTNAFYRTTYEKPPFEWVVHEVEKSEDVLLLIGFWQMDPTGLWQRLGGHWVTVAGVNGRDHTIAFSDPYTDTAELPLGQGRVLPFLNHPAHHDDTTVHNDAQYVSHDVWVVTATQSPGGLWGPLYYGKFFPWQNFVGVNPHPDPTVLPGKDSGFPVFAEVEYAVAVSPMEMFWKGAEGYVDYAPNGIPDFDQKQDMWGHPQNPPPAGPWTYCGPVAVANSLWWFDSKFEPAPVHPITPSDHFPLVQAYGPWDDHDIPNVGGGPPGAPPVAPGLVDELALALNTDGQSAGGNHLGTRSRDVISGIVQYLSAHGVADQFYTKTQKMPTFTYVCDEVEKSEDVVLLIGFWEYMGGFQWLRWGGHYVTVSGCDQQYRHIAFSDPYLDAAENLWSGRVLSGTLMPHLPPHPGAPDPIIHNDAGNISHDLYQVTGTLSPGGIWGPVEYGGRFPYWYFEGQNDGMYRAEGVEGTLGVVVAEVEHAFVVSPLPPDVVVRKAVAPTQVVPGDWVTFTIQYQNVAAMWAENVVISDMLPSGLISPTWDYATTSGKPITGADTYTWTVGTLGYQEGGAITLTARVDPTISDPTRLITNRVAITTTTREREPNLPNKAQAVLTVRTADVAASKSVTPSTLMAGDWLTYTIVFTSGGPVAATNVIITDLLHSWLVSDTHSIWTSYPAMLVAPADRYVWSLGSVPAGGWGLITVTARVSPTLSGGGTLSNAVSISTDTPEHDATNNDGGADATVIYYGVAVDPHAASGAGYPGETITYTLQITNTGNVADNIDLTHTKPASWTVTYAPTSALSLGGGAGATVSVLVGIPAGEMYGISRTITVTATSQGDPTKYDQAVLTTGVEWIVFLPSVLRGF